MSLLVQGSLFPKKTEQTTTTPVNLHRPLYIEKVEPKDYKLIVNIAKDWANIAQEKSVSTNSDKERLAWDHFSSIEFMAKVIANIEGKYRLKDSEQVYVCKEVVTEKVYGIVIGSQDRRKIYGSLLVTHPNNVRCEANRSEILRVKGVGTAFIKFVEEECKKQGKSLSFMPSPSSETFYQKFGYVHGTKSELAPASKL